jgi:Tol biopolymer transport system component
MKFLLVFVLAASFPTFSCKDHNTEPSAEIFQDENASLVIAYEVNGIGDIYLFYPYTNTKINITANVVDTMYYAYLSSFSDDGHELLYTLDYMKQGKEDLLFCQRDDIFSYNIITGKTKRLTNTEYKESNPRYSKDGKQIVYSTLEKGNYDIAAMNSDGNNRKIIASTPGYEWNPAFIMNDSKILYAAMRSSNSEFYTCNVDGTGEVQLTNSIWRVSEPSVATDNSFFVFSAMRSGNGADADLGMFSYDFITNTVRPITQSMSGVNRNYSPIVSPDSKKIVYKYFNGSWIYIRLADIDGKNEIDLGKGTDANFTKDGKFIIYHNNSGLSTYDIEKKTNDVILPNLAWGYNIEVGRIK